MGWEVVKDGDGFVMRDPATKRGVRFDNEADSHAAGEAVRLHLGRPRVSEILTAKESAERELNATKAALADERKQRATETAALSLRAAEMEAGTFEKEKLEVFQALHAEKQLTAKLRLEAQALRERAENAEGRRDREVPDPQATAPV